MRVLIASVRSRDAEKSVTIEADERWIEMRIVGSRRMPLHLQTPITVSRKGNKWVISDGAGYAPTADGLDPIEFSPLEQQITMARKQLPGAIRVVGVGDAAAGAVEFDVVNHVPLEEYLPGVLAKELFSHWHPEAFAAQAVAARSFACSEHALNAQRNFDVTATQRSQAYIGATDLAVARRAVDRTRGLVLGWQGALVPGYYSSCCGGIAASAVDNIGPHVANDVEPLRSRSGPDACGEAPVYRWETARELRDVSRRVHAFAEDRRFNALSSLGDIETIEIAEVNDHGRPTRFVFRDALGNDATLAARHIRAAVDFDTSSLPRVETPLRSEFVVPEVTGTRQIIFRGRGYGHGVGLCQYGAEALARRGLQYRAIVGRYYPGAELVSAYS